MSHAIEEFGLARRDVFEAVVGEVEEGRLSLRRPEHAGVRVDARNAVHGYHPSVGDRVLCTEGPGSVYVTGVLMAPPFELRSGETCARVEDGRLVVRGGDGALIVSFDPDSGVTRVNADRSVLSIEASERLELKAPEVTIEAKRLLQRVTRLVTEAEHVSTSTGRWDLRANRLTERARDVFRDVESLLQTRAGTIRSIARGGMSLFANRTSIRSKKDTAVDGERVLLG